MAGKEGGSLPSPSEAVKGYTELWKKSTAAKAGSAFVVGGALVGAGGLALIGLGLTAGSAGWHSEKNPFNKKK